MPFNNQGGQGRRRFRPTNVEHNARLGNPRNVHQNRRQVEDEIRTLPFCTPTVVKITVIASICISIILTAFLAIPSARNFRLFRLRSITGHKGEISYTIDETSEEYNSSSKIIQKCLKLFHKLRILDMQLKSFAETGEMPKLLKELLQPIQDEFSSLTTQTRLYEEMDKSYGPPKNFIDTSLERLFLIKEKLINIVDNELDRIMANDKSLWKTLQKSFESFLSDGRMLTPYIFSKRLAEFNIRMIPNPEMDSIDDGKYIENLLIKHRAEEIIELVEKLEEKVKNKEELYEQLKEQKDRMGLKGEDILFDLLNSDEDDPALYKLGILAANYTIYQQELDEFIKENDVLIMLFHPHYVKNIQRVSALVGTLNDYWMKRKRGCLDIMKRLRDDIENLIPRIRNLNYKYAKSAPKPDIP